MSFSGEECLKSPYSLYRIHTIVKREPISHPRVWIAQFLLLAMALPCAALDSPLAWLNSVRIAAGVRSVEPDALLSATAARWAATLAHAGVLSHRGADGTVVLDRYRIMGGTEAHVGEILGAGPTLADVENGWMGSIDHRVLALKPAWTHAGWGSAPHGSAQVWVLIFCEKLVADLSIKERGEGLVISGRFAVTGAAGGLLYNGLAPLLPTTWDASTRWFTFQVPAPAREGYFRLGYLDQGERFMLTNAFTLPRGTGFPEETGRFSPPAPSP
jgi:uncharacterized protein YkwD